MVAPGGAGRLRLPGPLLVSTVGAMELDRDTLQLVRKVLCLPAWALIRMPVFADVLREHLEWDGVIDEIVWQLARRRRGGRPSVATPLPTRR